MVTLWTTLSRLDLFPNQFYIQYKTVVRSSEVNQLCVPLTMLLLSCRSKKKKTLYGLNPQANYTDRATAAYR
jgi:hypothetical protein